ncbi:Murein hydrolase activator EnvC [Pseudoalteromonas holothuriae]|uniref:Murein hydrolase activator EnvC n=1 Tax=Pseudoalteromonas holothuriae TaxID=2963714 RepID=A0A9W4QVZ2_9GAMM|nr:MULTISPECIES: peptidoglycan DD-metalloendopeptidase family protein [unclassified Pseudoalteromonas]CAH9053431.1 Murein hydrolase activator EnvC [Pseudoalteromonas sp. CIP111951]CAH9056096.1 Murein hydrolase activator EnvC [Pseudoalteromonas sp. CIP111854]
MWNFPSKLILLALTLVATSVVANETRTKQDLTEVQQELKKSQQSYQKQQNNVVSLRKKLKQQELNIAKNAKALSLTQRGITENQQQQYTLKNEAKSLSNKKHKLQKLLAAQLKSAYMTGSHDYSKMLLNQQRSANLERAISYYDYFNKARITQLEELKFVFSELAKNQQQLARKQNELSALKAQQEQRQSALVAGQTKRQVHLQKLNAALQQTAQAIDYLKENEQTLISTLDDLAQTQQPPEIILDGLAQNKGRLLWPSKGHLRHRFGQQKHAGMSWKGVLIQAQSGAPVNSIKQGQVVYADWLNGFGWVMVIDHGEGFMSLYGHTQTLLKDVGDLVNAGETVALVGQSGGQARSGLYFEIRHKGSAVDPVKWCKAS